MKFAKSALFAATMLTAVSASAVEFSGNIAIGSDYYFRGVDQSGGLAVSGGFDATMLVTAVQSLIQLAMTWVMFITATHKTLAQRSLKSSTAAFLTAMLLLGLLLQATGTTQLVATLTTTLITVWRCLKISA
jgi:hypothetical protein